MAQQRKTDRLPHDPAFKAIFSEPRMIADALRGYATKPDGPLHPRTVAALDLDTLEKVPAEWITPLRFLRGLRERRLAGKMLDWALRRLGVEGETAEEMKRMASLDEFHSQLEERARGRTGTPTLPARSRIEALAGGRGSGFVRYGEGFPLLLHDAQDARQILRLPAPASAALGASA